MKYEIYSSENQKIYIGEGAKDALKSVMEYLLNTDNTIETIKKYSNRILLTSDEYLEKIQSSSIDNEKKQIALDLFNKKEKVQGIGHGSLRYTYLKNNLWVQDGITHEDFSKILQDIAKDGLILINKIGNNEIDFSDITREDILKAFQKYDELKNNNQLNKSRSAKDYLLFWNSKEYPHKYIVGIAYGLKYNQEIWDNTFYNSMGNHKASAEWCVNRNGFILYAGSKYKKFLEEKFENKTTINTYYSDLKKAIKIFQNIDIFDEKNLNDIFEIMLSDTINFEEYDKSQKELGFDDKQLFNTYKTKVRTYLEAIAEDNDMAIKREITKDEEKIFYQIANEYNLTSREPHMSSGRQYYQIYPKNAPQSEGTGGTHYEFRISGNNLILALHLENRVNDRKSLKEWLSIDNPSSGVREYSKIILTDEGQNKIRESFTDLVSQYEDKINEFYKMNENVGTTIQPLNQIFCGPPGTGKTYKTINKALEIIFEKASDDEKSKKFPVKKDEKGNRTQQCNYADALINDDRPALKSIFDYYKDEAKQIIFTTFHQSYGYEEFVEGIRAIPPGEEGNSDMFYKVVPGVLRKLTETAMSKGQLEKKDFEFDKQNTVWKMSLGDSQNKNESKIYFDEAIETNSIIMGYGNDIDFSNCQNLNDITNLPVDKTTSEMLDRFIFQLKIGDIVIISDGNRKYKAICRVKGEYKYDQESDLKQKREVDWLQIFSESRDAKEISEKYFTQVTLNRPQWIKKNELKKLLSDTNQSDNTQKSYILIIDEINRGNISKIFGELITLIEPSKRIGEDEEIKVTLPYSGDSFGVPNNLYIIGTMNTADRSIALMDTALRRRFEFTEMMPDMSVVHGMKVGEIKIKTLLEKINQRIEYLYDRDHTIGHAYFMSLKNKHGEEAMIELDNIFRSKIIPLLQEYFYDDWEKIRLVLGDNQKEKNEATKALQFIKIKEGYDPKTLFGDTQHELLDNDDSTRVYEINKNAFSNPESYIKIYG
jgi:5-methylcytosine-specific restriction protein B